MNVENESASFKVGLLKKPTVGGVTPRRKESASAVKYEYDAKYLFERARAREKKEARTTFADPAVKTELISKCRLVGSRTRKRLILPFEELISESSFAWITWLVPRLPSRVHTLCQYESQSGQVALHTNQEQAAVLVQT